MISFIKKTAYVKQLFRLIAVFILASTGIVGPVSLGRVSADDVTAPEIFLSHQGREILNGDTTPSISDFTDYGAVAINTGVSIGGYNINNSGTATLHLTSGSPYVFITGENSADFTLHNTPYSTVQPGLSIPIQIYFHPSSLGLKTATITIPNDDSDENPYTFSIQGTGVQSAPEISVAGNGIEIVYRHNSPGTADGTDFGIVNPGGGSETSTFEISNIGSAPLDLTGVPLVSISGANAAEFAVTAQPVSPIASGDSTSFQITFTPAGGGPRSATVSIANNDSDENPYSFSICGTGAGFDTRVTSQGTLIVNGDMTPSLTDRTDFSSAPINGGSVVHSFFIKNSGTVPVNLTGAYPFVIISGENAVDFAVTVAPSSPIGPGVSIIFQITFRPSAAGVRRATVSIATSDPAKNPYTFSIQGTGNDIPEIMISGNNQEIADGDTTPSTTDFTDFGGVEIASSSVVHEFNITNSGLAPLNLTGTPLVAISGANAADFTVTTLPVSPIAESGCTSFQISFHPSAGGLRTAMISISNDDSNENPYNFNIQGTGGVGEIKVTGNGQEITDGDITPSSTDYTDFGSTSMFHYPVSATFKIYNTGSTTLYLSGTPAVAIGGANASEFTVSTPPAATVEPGGYTSFVITFAPISPGAKNAVVSIVNNDPDENPYNFNIRGFATAPNIVLTGNGHEIVNGDITPSTVDFTDFGTVEIGLAGVTHTFTITNTGDAPYELFSEYPYIGTNNDDFIISSISSMVIPIGGSITFQMTFRPSTAGLSTTDVLITNKWGDEETTPPTSQLNFRVQGTGTGTTPEISITGNGHEIFNGDITPSTNDFTDFGSTDIMSGSVVRTFYILNTGSAQLTLSGSPIITISGVNAADFTVTALPVSPVAASNGSTSFQVTFNPSATGLRSAVISIANNDVNENPYNFYIQGTGSDITTPMITLAQYDAATGVLTVTGVNLISSPGANDDIDASKFTFTGEGGGTYTLVSTLDVDISSATQFTLVLSPSDKTAVNLLLNKTGASAVNGTIYNLAAAEDWAAGAPASMNVADMTGNSITVNGVTSPVIASAVYTRSSGTLVVTGTNFISLDGANNDIDASKFTFTGQGGTYTLVSTPDVDISSATQFTLYLSPSDWGAVNLILNKAGTTSEDGMVYNLAAADNWLTGADSAADISNPITPLTVVNKPPKIEIAYMSYPVPSGGDYNFGTKNLGTSTDAIFWIQNTGSDDLIVSSPFSIEGIYADQFSISVYPNPNILRPGQTCYFKVRFTPTKTGAKSALISITSNDPVNSPYMFYVSGTGTGIMPTSIANEWGEVDVVTINGTADIHDLIKEDGRFIYTVYVNTENKDIQLIFTANITGYDSSHKPLGNVSILPATNPPPVPLGLAIVGGPYELGPQGATFNNNVPLFFYYNQAKVPAGTQEGNFYVAWYDEAANKWVKLLSSTYPNDNLVCTAITHFSIYAILAVVPVPTVTPTPTATPTPTDSTPTPTTPEVIVKPTGTTNTPLVEYTTVITATIPITPTVTLPAPSSNETTVLGPVPVITGIAADHTWLYWIAIAALIIALIVVLCLRRRHD